MKTYCEKYGLPICYYCQNYADDLRMGYWCILNYYQKSINRDDIKKHIVSLIRGGDGLIYLRKAIEIEKPEFLDTFDKLLLLI